MSKEAIVQKILADAKLHADSFVEEQTEKAHEIIAEAAEECKNYIYAQHAAISEEVNDIEKRAAAAAELEVRKQTLAAKTKIIDAVFVRVLEKLKALDNADMKKLFLAMLNEADDGDVVILGKEQAGVLSAKDVEKFAAEKGIKLSLSEKLGDFDGMVLASKNCDKNFTFEAETESLREELQMQIAKEIFEDVR